MLIHRFFLLRPTSSLCSKLLSEQIKSALISLFSLFLNSFCSLSDYLANTPANRMTVCNYEVTALVGVRLFPSRGIACVSTSPIRVLPTTCREKQLQLSATAKN
ncbi:hypothetical protein ATANTOWER_014637 [Ataeniobius toweri]|uniref:Secreted protein n=1 Tax=Ataeniobius toweri TaxID=208326 RepID=A0ABU7AG07_9TELE|nr:hypothetical protein [Ataeniobius toweri]